MSTCFFFCKMGTWVEDGSMGALKDIVDVKQLLKKVDKCYLVRQTKHHIIPAFSNSVGNPIQD